MRLVFALTLLSGTVALTQEPEVPKDPDPRFGVPVKLKVYPQTTAKKALGSAVEALARGETAYLVAHLLDPGFVDFRLADRAKQYEAEIEVSLARLRDMQIRNPDKYQPEDRLPTDRVKFAALIVQQSRDRAFKQLVRDVSDKILDDPESFKDMRKLLSDGTFADTETGAKVTHPAVKDRALYFRKIGDRWFLEDRQEDLPPPKEPEKKEPEKKGPGM
jgi:hypothetical protein